jgi:hypothetical protein
LQTKIKQYRIGTSNVKKTPLKIKLFGKTALLLLVKIPLKESVLTTREEFGDECLSTLLDRIQGDSFQEPISLPLFTYSATTAFHSSTDLSCLDFRLFHSPRPDVLRRFLGIF